MTVGIGSDGEATFPIPGVSDVSDYMSFEFNPVFPPSVPEPSSLALMAAGWAGVAGVARRRNRRTAVVAEG